MSAGAALALPPSGNDTVPPVSALGGPDRALSSDEEAQWLHGRALFTKPFKLRDGLGPLFDADSCVACHNAPVVGGAGGRDVNVVHFGFHNLFTDSFQDVSGGPIVSKLSIPGRRREEVGAGANVTQERNPPSLLGLGLIDQLPDSVLTANVMEGDDRAGVITGVAPTIDGSIGRFGYKSDRATLRDAVADALGNYMGITLPASVSRYAVASDDDGVADPEMLRGDFEDLVFFVSHLAPPPPVTSDLDGVLIAQGRDLFEQAGCTQCHVAQLVNTSDGTTLNLYSDVLLHSLRPPPSTDASSPPDVTSGAARPREFRTSPLWGFRYTAPYMHDGKSYTLDEIVNRHGWEALTGERVFQASFTDDQRRAVLEFLRSL
jgi:CxxC motif-containing protein (DUF1111 family)